MNQAFRQFVLDVTEAESITSEELIQTLWSGYGELVRVGLSGGKENTAIVKYIVLPDQTNHPRGWNTSRSHERKIKSYDVEMHWYHDWSHRCDDSCRVPVSYASESHENERIIILEDLDNAGYGLRKQDLTYDEVLVCLKWLANFHATFLQETPVGLWQTGTYWHLATRPDELAAMEHMPLKNAATRIDATLSDCKYQTFVHGDAKVANFCFSLDGTKVAAVDFQYVGGGCGMKDVAYLLGSCLSGKQCAQWDEALLDFYFEELQLALSVRGKKIDFENLQAEWRPMYAFAWADFYRFLLGWMPTHKKVNFYCEQMADKVLNS